MMTETETNLLRRFSQEGDADAFAQITRQYAGMVYGTCLRITGNQEEAADAAQDTFFQLLKNASQVTGSVGGWLHRVAIRRAVDMMRRNSSRRQREQEYASLGALETERWADVSPYVDEAINELDPELQDVLRRYFLEGATTSQIAASIGVNQSTISRRLEQALAQLRDQLRKKGILVAVAALSVLLVQAAQTAPASLVLELGKMAAAASSAAGTATTTALAGLKFKLVAAAVLVGAGVGGIIAYKQAGTGDNAPPPSRLQVQQRPNSAPATPGKTPVVASLPSRSNQSNSAPLTSASAPAQSISRRSTPVSVGQPGAGGTPTYGVAAPNPSAPGWQPMGFGGVSRSTTAPIPPASTPEGAVYRFASALTRGDMTRLERCFVPGTAELDTFRRTMENPQTEAEQELKLCLQCLGTPVEVLETKANDDVIQVKWRATVKKTFTRTEQGVSRIWQKGDKYDLEVSLKPVGTELKILKF